VYEICMMLELRTERTKEGTWHMGGFDAVLSSSLFFCYYHTAVLYSTLLGSGFKVLRIKLTGYKSQRIRTLLSIQSRTRARRSIPINA